MSHFSVMVIGGDVDAQLQPYHEYECTGIVDQYVIWIDCTEEVKEAWEKADTVQGDMDTFARDYFGYEVREVDGVKQWGRMTNPNKKWDWWVIGGRWAGSLKLKPGAAGNYGERSWTNRDKADDMDRCDQARKGDIDVQGMRDEAVARAEKAWDSTRGVPPCPEWLSFDRMMELHPDSMEAARDAYWAQPEVACRKAVFWSARDLDAFLMPREQYIERARNGALAQFAYVKDSKWFERGEMGWFACVSDEKDPDAWNRQFNEAFDALPDDTLITIVDCHI